MASIVYEGDVGGGGNLFAGIKFFFLQRVPDRQKYMKDVTNNGGEIVLLEKQADIVIADHARKVSPTGSISWTFIDKSVKEKRLEDIEHHRAGPTSRTIREVGSTQPMKSGRTPFTAQDDRELMLWVTKAERNGLSIKGNDIYKQFEEINPRHTFQSWRDRWIKYLAERPRPKIPEDEISAQAAIPLGSKYSNHLPPPRRRRTLTPDGDSDIPHSIKQEPQTQNRSSVPANGRPKPPARESAPKSAENKPKEKSIVQKTNSMVPLVRKSTGGMNFTEEEDNYMLENYQIMADVDGKRGVDAWAKIAIENPNHSAQEWHNYFVQTIKPFMEKKLQNLTKAASPPEEIMPPAIRASSSKPSKARSSAENEDYEVLPPEPIEAQTTRKKFPDPSTKDEKMFTEDLTAMTEENDIKVNFNPIVCGRKIPLFRLWQVINLEEFGGYDEVQGRNMWPRIARRLDFNDFRHPGAPKAIKSAYEEVLPDFEAVREEFMAQLQVEEMIASQLRQTADRDSMEEELVEEGVEVVEEEEDDYDDYDDDLEAPASVPRLLPSSKRSFETDHMTDQDGSPVLGSYSKRQRLEKGKGKELEIPSTPEDVINPDPKRRPTYQSSPLKYMQTGAEHDEAEELFVGPAKKTKLPVQRQNRRNLEPETQDFNFLSAVDDAGSDSSLLSLPNRRKAKKIGAAAHSSPNEDSSTQSQNDSSKAQELIAFVENHQALGYRREIVIEALESTCMTTGNAATVMEALTSGKGIPDNIQGVWTEEDDAALEDVESKDFEAVANKHGTKSVALRQKFLEQQHEAKRELGVE